MVWLNQSYEDAMKMPLSRRYRMLKAQLEDEEKRAKNGMPKTTKRG